MRKQIIGLLVLTMFLIGCTLDNLPSNSPKYVYGGPSVKPTAITPIACDQTDITARANCMYELATFSEKPEMCSQILMKDQMDRCNSFFATKKLDSSYCDKITGEEHDRCILDLAVNSRDIALCNKINSNATLTRCKNYLIDANPVFCDRLQSNGEKDACYLGAAISREDAPLCDKIKSIATIERCYMILDAARINSELCSKMPDIETKDGCYKDLGISSQKAEPCYLIIDWLKKKTCLLTVAASTKDAAICQKIGPQNDVEECMKGITN
jgi:hypothetical protein